MGRELTTFPHQVCHFGFWTQIMFSCKLIFFGHLSGKNGHNDQKLFSVLHVETFLYV